MYTMQNQLGFADCGADGRLKLASAMTLMMNSCQFQEQQEKGFCSYLREHHIAVFLYSIQLDIYRMPQFLETVTTAVKIYGCRSIYGLRRLTIRDEKGELCLIANATGAFFDLAAQKAVKIAPAEINIAFDTPEEMECLPRKIAIPSATPEIMPPYLVTSSRLDPNGHLTSAEYLALAQDRLPDDFSFNRVRIEYKQQAKKGESLQILRHTAAGNAIIADIRGANGLSCAVTEFSTAKLH
ncbi:MAG: hypothetical protein E7041_07815 [Lentisphaerae bacterium]|nr:hypothetical protein [Lentisphaerota bacterium]